MNNSATEMLVSATIEFLHSYPPFDRMETEALRFLAEHLKLAYYPKESLDHFAGNRHRAGFPIVQRGKVLARQASEVSVMEQSVLTLGLAKVFRSGP